MSRSLHPLLATLLVASGALSAVAQQPPVPTTTAPAVTLPAPKPAVPTGVAATVNGTPILEVAVQRGLKRVPPAHQAAARPELLDLLIDNVVIDQHLQQLGIQVDQKEIDARMQQVREEINRVAKTKPDMTYEKLLAELMLSEDELRAINASDLRWDKYATQQATDKVVREFFEKNKELFDGTLVRARHILLTPAANDPKAAEQAKAELLQCRQEVEKKAAEAVAKLPPTSDALSREQARTKALEDAFGEMARQKSSCPSKQQGGDVDWFPRGGSMVEPFAAAAFALKSHEMTVVQTQFGLHLILTTDRKPGKETKFEDVQADAKEIYCDRMREQLATQLRPTAKIVITPTKP